MKINKCRKAQIFMKIKISLKKIKQEQQVIKTKRIFMMMKKIKSNQRLISKLIKQLVVLVVKLISIVI
jgi:hypothetical protein